ncbi:capsid protein [Listeria newyorkensis]|uniref:Capsid protein n=1 Tax=Listeria newyorkensis TaxID=1497681 RepID=A0A841Z2J1_9LIST|nr:capsid protein [Listeria newyorkensis]MBC1459067.1 capsid protein [Listeria newyorkensis]
MPVELNFATDYQRALQEPFKHMLQTAELWNSPSNNIIQWTGHNTVKLPTLKVTEGLRDRSRRTIGTFGANYSNDWETYTLKNERDWQTLIDPSDVDETNFTTTMANVTRVFNEDEKIPEKDKFMFSSLYAQKKALDGTDGIFEEIITEANVLRKFDDMMQQMDEEAVPGNRVLYITPAIERIIKRAEGLTRNFNVQQNNQVIDTRISRIDEVTLRTVAPDRFKTLFNFTNGAVVDPTAQQIQMMLIHIPVMCAPEKYSFAGFTPPSAITYGNWLYYEQFYNDVILFEQRSKGIQFVVKPI